MALPAGKTSFANGEIAPALFGHVDLERFSSAASTMRNMFVGFRGGSYSRAGCRFVGRSKQRADLGQPAPRFIPFRFSISQQYVLEFGNFYFRIISNGGFVTETAINVTAATKANPCQLTVPGHAYSNGDWVQFTSIGGMSELNGNSYIVATSNPGAGTFTLQDLKGVDVNSTAYGTYTSGGTCAKIYTVAAPYAAADVAGIKYSQSADVMSLCHPNYAPQEVKRLAAVNWTIDPAAFGASVNGPQGCLATATTTTSGTLRPASYAYCVTSIDPNTGQESAPSPIANVLNSVDMAVTAGSIKVEWGDVTNVNLYNVYRTAPAYNTGDATNAKAVPVGAQFGLIGQSFGTDLIDSNITPDFAHSPPMAKKPFDPGQVLAINVSASSSDWTVAVLTITTVAGVGFTGRAIINSAGKLVGGLIDTAGTLYNDAVDTVVFTGDGTSYTATLKTSPASGTYPSLVSYFQQRRVYAATLNQPDTYWMSQTGAFLDFDVAIPVIDSDAITGTPWSEQVAGIQWMLQMPLGLVTFTPLGIWQVSAGGNSITVPQAITPANQIATSQSSIGCSPSVMPQKIDWNILYLDAHGASVRELAYQIFFNIFTGTDISWPSSHLLTGHQITDWAWCQEPYRVLWAVRDDGILLSLTYVKEQQVAGWARHTTQGLVRAVCSITELPSDVLYLCTERFPNGSSAQYMIERMDTRIWQSVEDTWAVDAAVATNLPLPVATISATSATGAGVAFSTNANAFTAQSVGQIIRMGGGIAKVTTYNNAKLVIGDWLYPCQQLIPDDGSVIPQLAGSWSISISLNAVGGLLHLAGVANLVGLADGVPIGPLTVSATGFVTLPFAASKVVLGLGYIAQLQAVPIEAGQPTLEGRRKRIVAVTAKIENSAVCTAGANQQDASVLSPPPNVVVWPNMDTMPTGGATLPATYLTSVGQVVQPMFTGDIRIPVSGQFDKHGQVAVQQTLPLPLAVLEFVPEFVPGDTPEEGYKPRPTPQAQPQRRAA